MAAEKGRTAHGPSGKPAAERYARGSRSYIMSRIRGRDTSIEVQVRSYLFRRGLRFRKNDRRYPGHPDVVLPRYHAVVFVNGCFWHRHEGCRYATVPKTNVEFWTAKLERNRARDERQRHELEAMGWRVLTVWECELRDDRDGRLDRLYHDIVDPDRRTDRGKGPDGPAGLSAPDPGPIRR